LEQEQNVQENVNDNTAQETQVVRRSGRIHHESERYYEFLFTQDGYLMLVNNDNEPLTYQDAMNIPRSKSWQEAMKSKMDSMYEKPSMDFG
jgi:hypothetical protein